MRWGASSSWSSSASPCAAVSGSRGSTAGSATRSTAATRARSGSPPATSATRSTCATSCEPHRREAMTGYLKRLISSLGAYQASNVVAKLIGVGLLPVYTAYINRSGYGTIELLANGVILISIVTRLGMIEAFLRFYYEDEDVARRNHLVRRATLFMLVATTVITTLLAVFAAPLSRVALGRHDVAIFRVAVLGLWSFTNLELAYAVLRVDERLRAYATASVCNVLLTVAATVTLVVGAGLGARGYLLGNYGASTVVLLALWWTMRGRLRAPERTPGHSWAVLMRFGLPTVPAEASVYLLSIVDRAYIYHE